MLKVVHIHTDPKFINSEKIFFGEAFENESLLLSDADETGRLRDHPMICFKKTRKGIVETIRRCENADLVVLYGLDVVKSYIANRLPDGMPVAWRFFGYELYDKKKDIFLSESAREFVQIMKTFCFRTLFQKATNRIVFMLKMRMRPGTEFKHAVKRINVFLCFSEEEHDLLRNHWKNIPKLLKLPIGKSSFLEPYSPIGKKQALVVLGNSRNIFNNHVDIIEGIHRSKNKDKPEFVLLFNYGKENLYTRSVRRKIAGLPGFKAIENFMTVSELKRLYDRAGSLVVNGYRQMALGNIFLAIRAGVKIYLSEKSSTFHWLRREGFCLYSTDQFYRDLEDGDLVLGENEIRINHDRLKALQDSWDVETFQRKICDEIMMTKKTSGFPDTLP
jgi:dTDP-N-acetylfucosamine:lipid II N-acetylfucosaminyltransferase